MPSFDAINYSLRPNKSIQRQLVFDGAQLLHKHLGLNAAIYIGFGSIWFTDFVMAHKILGATRSISVEADDVGFKRAKFNAPFATVDVRHGLSTNVLPAILGDEELSRSPWMIWLDYDFDFNETVGDDIRLVVEQAPKNTIFLVTFNGLDRRYGRLKDRVSTLKRLLGAVVPDHLTSESCEGDSLRITIADLVLAKMVSIAQDAARPGGFTPAFRILYQDGAPMVTVGGILSAPESAEQMRNLIEGSNWPCRPGAPIVAPHLTIKEASALQAQLPRTERLTRAAVQALGFDLEEGQVEAFEKYYLKYPAFAQILS